MTTEKIYADKKSKSKNKYKGLLATLVIAFLIIFIIVEYVYLVNKTKVIAPASSKNSISSASNSSSGSTSQFDTKDSTTPTTTTPTTSTPNSDSTAPTSTPSVSADTYYSQGLDFVAQKQYDQAINNFNQAIALNPNVPNYYIAKDEAQVSLGNKTDAIATIQAGLAANPNNPNLENELAIIQATVK